MGKRGEMTQTLYAHLNKKNNNNVSVKLKLSELYDHRVLCPLVNTLFSTVPGTLPIYLPHLKDFESKNQKSTSQIIHHTPSVRK
jgi:hypothetical protein